MLGDVPYFRSNSLILFLSLLTSNFIESHSFTELSFDRNLLTTLVESDVKFERDELSSNVSFSLITFFLLPNITFMNLGPSKPESSISNLLSCGNFISGFKSDLIITDLPS